jgi:hypothetical protein
MTTFAAHAQLDERQLSLIVLHFGDLRAGKTMGLIAGIR